MKHNNKIINMQARRYLNMLENMNVYNKQINNEQIKNKRLIKKVKSVLKLIYG